MGLSGSAGFSESIRQGRDSLGRLPENGDDRFEAVLSEMASEGQLPTEWGCGQIQPPETTIDRAKAVLGDSAPYDQVVALSAFLDQKNQRNSLADDVARLQAQLQDAKEARKMAEDSAAELKGRLLLERTIPVGDNERAELGRLREHWAICQGQQEILSRSAAPDRAPPPETPTKPPRGPAKPRRRARRVSGAKKRKRRS
jgi:small-conductance mechanosensitive channel